MVEDCTIGYSKARSVISQCLSNNKLESWYLRNDSKNVSASLNNEDYQLKFITDNTCYCNQNIIKPKLLQRSKNCINPIEEVKLKPKVRFDYRHSNQKIDNENDNNNKNGNDDVCSCYKLTNNDQNNQLNYTERRQNYEQIIRCNEVNTKPELNEISKGREPTNSSYFKSNNEIEKVRNTQRENNELTKEIDKKNQELLKRLSDFRNDHYFETHSTDISNTKIPPHICKYKFQLNNRNLSEGKNTDVYGVSRCVICSKPILNKSQKDERRNLPKYYKYNLISNEINLGNESNVEIEMKINKNEDNLCLDYLIGDNKRKYDYTDTYALRYQKGVY